MPDPTREQFPESQQPGGEIRDRAKRPSGLLPKNTQTYVVLGITAIMVGAIAFSGGGSPSKPSSATAPKTQAVIDPSLARIQEYRERINEQARKLAAEQAQLEQTKQALGLPAATQSNVMGGPMPAGGYSQPAPPPRSVPKRAL
jgi:hypothetical protein